MFCNAWKANPLVNPRTNRVIKVGGPTYKKLAKECGDDQPVTPPVAPVPRPLASVAPVPRPLAATSGGWIDQRIATSNQVAQDLENIDIHQWEICLSGKKKDFKRYFSNVRTLTSGSYGQVYLAKLHDNTIIVKEAVLEKEEKNAMQRAIAKTQRSWRFPEDAWPSEYTMLSWVKQLVMTRKCPNFLLAYHMAACEGCEVKTMDGKKKMGDCYIMFMEPASYDLAEISSKIKDKDTQESFLYQLLAAVYAIEKYYQIQHNDIKQENILIKETPHLKGMYFDYVINGAHYYVKNMGYTLYLSDFGVSRSFSPTYSTEGYYGERNAEVKICHRNGDNVCFYPFTSNKFITPGKTKAYVYTAPLKFKWKDGVKGTHNRFYKRKNIGINRPVDLNNVDKFPPFEFFYDIQDVIRTFTGGKRTTQPGNHSGFQYLDTDLRDKLEHYVTRRYVYFNMFWSVTDVHYFIASRMLEQLYVPIHVQRNLIGTYNMV